MATPKLGTLIDKLYKQKAKITQQKKAMEKEEKKLSALKQAYKKIEDDIINALPKDKLEGASGKLARIQITENAVPSVEDWDKVYAFIHKKKAYHLLNKSLKSQAWRDYREDGVAVPGTKGVILKSISLRKI